MTHLTDGLFVKGRWIQHKYFNKIICRSLYSWLYATFGTSFANCKLLWQAPFSSDPRTKVEFNEEKKYFSFFILHCNHINLFMLLLIIVQEYFDFLAYCTYFFPLEIFSLQKNYKRKFYFRYLWTLFKNKRFVHNEMFFQNVLNFASI